MLEFLHPIHAPIHNEITNKVVDFNLSYMANKNLSERGKIG